MAPGLNGSQTGTVPKNKSRSCDSQTHRLTNEPFVQSAFLEWEHMSEAGNKNYTKKKSSTSRSEAEADSLRHEIGRSRSSTMTSQNENAEGCSHDNFPGKVNIPDRKQVVNKLSQIQSYVQQTAALMSTLKASDSPNRESQYNKLSVMLEDLQDSEIKLSALLNKMDTTESRIDSLLGDVAELQGDNNLEAEEEELTRRSKESKRKLEVLQKRKQELLKLQDKAKKQLQEAQAEQSRLVARATSLNQELNAGKVMDLNVQQLNQRLKAVQEIYNIQDQISESLNEGHKSKNMKTKRPEERTEISENENDFQLVADKMEGLDAMKEQIQQIMSLISAMQTMQNTTLPSDTASSGESVKEQVNQTSQNSSFSEGDQFGEDGNNLMKLEQAKLKLNHLTQLLEIVQSAQNTNGLSPTYLQLMSNLVGEETNSCTGNPSPTSSVKSPQRERGGEIAVQTMQVMTKELEETTAAMKEERDRLLAARQELQDIAKRLPLNKSEPESVSPDYDTESEPPCLKPVILDSNIRNSLNGLREAEQSSNCNDSSSYIVRPVPGRNRQRGMWGSTSPASNCTTQERRSKNESISRSFNPSSRENSRSGGRNVSQTTPSPSISCYNERPSALTESQQQLEMSGNLCEMMLAESLPRNVRPNDISLQEMFSQHQLLTRTVAQCSQLLWLQQKQIIELRNAIMLQCGSYCNQQLHIAPNQSHLNVSAVGNPYLTGPSISNVRQIPPVTIQQHQNFLHPFHQNVKFNVGEMQNIQASHQDFPDQCLPHGNQTINFPDGFGCDLRSGNFGRFNPSNANTNHNFHQNLSSGFNNRGLNGMNSLVPEDSGALNNQVPPGNRANNYWDNFRSYSRQNLLSNTKSNEDSELYRRCLAVSSQDRPLRDSASSFAQNNQSGGGTSQHPAFLHGNCETASIDQFLLPPSQNTRTTHHGHTSRSGSVEPQSQRNPIKNESRHQENDSRNLNSSAKNDGLGSGRVRNPDSTSDIRSVRNDVTQGFRNTDNINTTRNFIQMVREINNEDVAHGNNKKRLESTRYRSEGLENLNNRGYQNTSLWDNIYAEVSNFIRANESRPHFLLQLFRDLQLVTTDNLRQRTLVAIQETGTANNLTERTSNMSGININVVENRNNIRENRSNLNRNLTEDHDRIDQLFYHLREHQNTIRQNIGMSSYILGGNLENPNISNIRDLGNSRNNIENEGLRDLRTYFEANLCNFGHNSTLENPNLSNIRENLTRRVPGMSELENAQPKNVFLSIYDNAVEPRRHNQESAPGPDFGSTFRNYHLGNDFVGNEISENCENIRARNNDFEVENNIEDIVGNGAHYQPENRPTSSRYSLMDAADNFGRCRQHLGNGNDSGIDINYNNEERKRIFAEGDSNGNDDSNVKTTKNEISGVEGAVGLVVHSEWEGNGGREVSFESSLNSARKSGTSGFTPICDNTFFHCRSFQQSDNGDLAEADQSRNEETSGAESDSGFISANVVDSGVRFSPNRNRQSLENNFSAQTIPESERNFRETKNCENDCNIDGPCASSSEGNFKGNQERNSARINDGGDGLRKNEASEGYFYLLNASSSFESPPVQKPGHKHIKKAEETNGRESAVDINKSSCKNSTNKFRDSCFSQGKKDDFENRKTDMDSSGTTVDGRQQTESRDSLFYGAFQLALEKSVEAEKGNTSPEAESDWECGSGLDQVPTRLNKKGSSKKSEDSNGSGS